MTLFVLTALFILAALSMGATAQAHRPGLHRVGTLETPLFHWDRSLRRDVNAKAEAKCLPDVVRRFRFVYLIPRELRLPAIHDELARLEIVNRAASQCNPIGPPGTVKLGKAMAAARGWVGGQWDCLESLWGHLEGGWYVYADNPRSSAYGIPQALPGSKMGPGWQSSARVQIRWGLGYVAGRYGTPCSALDHRLANGWY